MANIVKELKYFYKTTCKKKKSLYICTRFERNLQQDIYKKI